MSTARESPQGKPCENAGLLQGLRNPVLRTYLFPNDSKNWSRYFLQLTACLGLLMLSLGPLSGSFIIPRLLKQDAARRQLISPEMDCHKPTNSSQTCLHSILIEYHMFNITNSDDFTSGRSPPTLDAIGPFIFGGFESNWDVRYSQSREVVHKRVSLQLSYSRQLSCENCDANMDKDLHFINREDLAGSDSGSGLVIQRRLKTVLKAMAMDSYRMNYSLLNNDGDIYNIPRNFYSEHSLDVQTGYRDISKTSCIIEPGIFEPGEAPGRDGRKFFGPGFNLEAQMFFDRWLTKNIPLKSSQIHPATQGLETRELILDIKRMCSDKSCINGSWNATQQFGVPTIITLPFFEEMDPGHKPSWLKNSDGEDIEHQKWKFHVDTRYGFTIDSQTTYQVSHSVSKDANHLSIWVPNESYGTFVPSHWVRVRYNISESDLKFIESLHFKERVGYYTCTIACAAAGSILLANSLYQLVFSQGAKIRFKTMRILLRSRARDPMLNPAQYTALRHFMVSQMKKPPRTRGTDEVDAKQGTQSKKGSSSQ